MNALRGLRLSVSLLLASAATAGAHHMIDGELPGGALEGLLSGLAHPVIGIDHALALVAVALLARSLALPLAFVAGSVVGVALPAAGLVSFANETMVVLSVAALGGWLAFASGRGGRLAALVAASIGTLHGFAYAQAIVGAETTPLLAYGLGLVVGQTAIVVALSVAARRFAPALPSPEVWLERVPGTAIAVAAVAIFFGLA